MSHLIRHFALRGMRTNLLLWLVFSGCFFGTQGEVLTSRDGGTSDASFDTDAGGDAGLTDAGFGTQCDPSTQVDAWPVRIILGLERGGPTCIVDPPGFQESPGLCEVANLAMIPNPDGGLFSRRYRAMESFRAAPQAPSVRLAVTYYGNFHGNTVSDFLSPSSGLLTLFEHSVAPTSDLQAALSMIKFKLEETMKNTPAAERAVTNYVVVLLSAGIPYPRCTANDALPSSASPERPDGIWRDDVNPPRSIFTPVNCLDSGGPPYDWCSNPNWIPPPTDAGAPSFSDGGYIYTAPTFSPCDLWYPGADYNQNYQLLELVDSIVALKANYGAGDVKVHTVMNFDQTQLKTCGAACTYLFYPFATTSVRPAGQWLLQQLASHGRGSFIDPPDLTPIDFKKIPGLQPLNGTCQE